MWKVPQGDSLVHAVVPCFDWSRKYGVKSRTLESNECSSQLQSREDNEDLGDKSGD